MISLIKNELFKIFHKKSTIIILLITLGFIILNNVLYKFVDLNKINFDDIYISSIKEEIKKLDANKDKEQYANYKTEIESYELKHKYGVDSWQFTVIENNLTDIINDINYSKYVEKDNNKVNIFKKEYDKVVKILNDNDWVKYAEYEKSNLTTLLNNPETTEDEKIDLEKNINKINTRIEKQIIYSNNYLNDALNYYDANFPTLEKYLKVRKDELKEDFNELKIKNNYKDERLQNEKYKYALENRIDLDNNKTLRHGLINMLDDFSIFIIILCVTVAGNIVSSEFDKGTIKLLLIRPFKRSEILLSKIITSLIIIIISFLFVFAFQFIIGGLFFRFNSLKIPVLVYNFNLDKIQYINVFKYVINMFIASIPQLILLTILSITISTIINNSVMGVAIPLLGFFMSGLINTIVSSFKLFFTKYLVTMNWDLTTYLYGGLPTYNGLSLSFSIIVCLVYLVVLLIPTFIVFNKRNIKNI